MFLGRNRAQGMGDLAAIGAQVLAGVAGVDGQEGGQDLRHGRRQGAGAGAAAAAAGLAGAGARAQREQLARARAQQGRQNVPPLQERRAAHQVKCAVPCGTRLSAEGRVRSAECCVDERRARVVLVSRVPVAGPNRSRVSIVICATTIPRTSARPLAALKTIVSLGLPIITK